MKKILLLCILSLSCAQKQEQQKELAIDDNIPEIANNVSVSENNYQFSNDSINQLIEFDFLKKKELRFKFMQENKLDNTSFSIQGIAKLSSGSEIDEDETGLSYQVEEYVSEDINYGTIYIRIGRQSDSDKLRIIQVDYDGTDIIMEAGILSRISVK